MRKRFTITIVLALVLVLGLGGCAAGLPSGFEAETVEQKAHEIVGYLNARDYAAVERAEREDVRSALGASVLEQALGEMLNGLGAFKQIDSTTLTSTKGESGEEYAVAVVTASYENGKAVYTISIDADLLVVGLYMR